MSSRIITAEIFDAFLKCESKAYFKSSGQIGEPDELTNWQREVRQEFRRSCQWRYRSIFQDAFDASQPLSLDEVKSGSRLRDRSRAVSIPHRCSREGLSQVAASLLRLRRLLDTKVKMVMPSAARIKPFVTSRAREFAPHVLMYG